MESKIFFLNSKGDKLCGILSNPTGDKSKPIIVFVHGFNSSKDSRGLTLVRQLLEQKNVSTFRFDLFGQGESEGKFEELTLTEGIDDVLNAIKYLNDLGYKKIGLVGSSFGGNASIHIATKINNINLLVLISSAEDYEEQVRNTMSLSEINEWKEKGYRILKDGKKINYRYYQDVINHKTYQIASQITIPTLIVHGDADESVPVTQSIKISKIINGSELILIKGGNHHYTNPVHYQEMSNAVAEFIFEKIKA